MTTTVGTVAEIWRFPVKSMQGERVERSAVDERGVDGDRSHAVIDIETGTIASAKRGRWGSLLDLHAEADDGGRVRFPDGTALGFDDPALDDRLTEHTGRAVRLASTAPTGATFEEAWHEAKADSPLYGPVVGSEDHLPLIRLNPSPAAPKGTFFDFSAIHLVTTSSLRALQEAHPGGDVDVRRFRPNLLVATDEAGFLENDWAQREFLVGEGIRLRAMMRTMRCAMTTLAQPGLEHDKGVLHAAAAVNRIDAGGLGSYPCLGVYLRVVAGGVVAEGDTVGLVD